MKIRLLLLFVILILSTPKSGAHATIKFDTAGKFETDTLKDQFNAKKHHIAALIKGNSPRDISTFYQFYLQEKDQLRADSLVREISKSGNSEKLKEYQRYFSKFKISLLESNVEKRAHYYNLVALDSAYYKVAPDSLVKLQMSHHYNSLAWYSIVSNQLNGVEHYLDQSLKYDPQYKYPLANLPLLLLLKGHYRQARALYIKFKDQPFEGPDFTFKDEFLEDFNELAKVGVTSGDIKKITALLISK
ncbi:hypothetical protein SAMN06265348_105326 [Pedobacter westerhofensis]|uniref:Tetratricopeptide repeat-containing protein n=1 Tax=Pedobacter westerhofensis TaxID=425512 RepID=A0A521DFU5_9SPHI|nr:hypothetical protein [Pedobacter westerhofensis]SMO70452.1 hypothetical protein SAMN06265348_105326 [Pedobacter westerhofensis]